MGDKAFVDTNVLLYARDQSDPAKQSVAEALLRDLWNQRSGRISVQVLNEYYVNVTQKLKPGLSREEAWEDIRDLQAWRPLGMDMDVLALGYDVQGAYGLSWWDSLIIAAADILGCRILYSEDLSETQRYRGIVVINPFS
jgi:predicted nucleic acid-binding protein